MSLQASAAPPLPSGALRDAGRVAAQVVAGHRPVLIFVAAAALITVSWSRVSGLTITGTSLAINGTLLALALGISWEIGGALLTRRAGRSAAGQHLGKLGRGIGTIALWAMTSGAALAFSYLMARLALPLHDAALAAADRWLGFDWPRWYAFVRARPLLATVLEYAYRSHAVQFPLAYLVVAWLADRRRLVEFYWIATVSVFAACAIGGLYPVLGAQPYFGEAGAKWVDSLLLVRQAGPLVLPFAAMTGIVSLPSFHTMLGLIFTWGVRRTPLVWPVAALNAVMIVSTLSVGGHYLIDVVTGIGLGIVIIAAVNRLVYARASVIDLSRATR